MASAIISCCGNGDVRVQGVMTCRMTYLLNDDFDNPLDFEGVDADGYNGPFHKYDLIGAYSHGWKHRFDSGPSDCGCDAERTDPA
jgi:hypothetical protein